MYMSVNDMSVGRSRLERVFRYMKALNDERNPVVRRVDEHSPQWVLWLHDLPVHPCVTLAARVGEDAGRDGGGLGDLSESDGIVLRVRRPQLREAPRIPESLVGWTKPVWEQPDGSAEVYDSLEHVGEDQPIQSVAFAASARRVTDFAAWSECWQEWSAKERVAREVSGVFEKLYALYGIIQREAQRVELIVGDGVLSWRLDDGGIHHPLILIRVQLDFNADVPEFTIRETGLDPELYTALFGASADVDARAMAACRRDFDTGEFHPLAGPNTDAFLARMVVALSPRGEFIGRGTHVGERDEPRIGRDPVIFLRRRTAGFARAIEATIEDIRVTDQLPAALMRIMGVDCGQNREDEQHSDESLEQPSEDAWAVPEDVLLGKPANAEQIRIARTLESRAGVLVQGPPGTGKTHTIANLIGHLLAQGKSVLVTSHTAKSLRVLREKIASELQPLCVSVLESEVGSRRQLRDSVDGIVSRLSSADRRALEYEARSLAETRHGLIGRLLDARNRLCNARWGEYRDVVVAGKAYAPSMAASLVTECSDADGWIPGPVVLGAPLPLSEEELAELYRSNCRLPPEDEIELERGVPGTDVLVPPSELEALHMKLRELFASPMGLELPSSSAYWKDAQSDGDEAEALVQLAHDIDAVAAGIDTPGEWQRSAIEAGRDGGLMRESWDRLIETAKRACEWYLRASELEAQYGSILIPQGSREEQAEIVRDIMSSIGSRTSIARLSLLLRRDWIRLVRESSVAGHPPVKADEFKALSIVIQAKQLEEELRRRWAAQVASRGGPTPEMVGEPFAVTAHDFCGTHVVRSLEWFGDIWRPIEIKLKSVGFGVHQFLSDRPAVVGPHARVVVLEEAISGPIQRQLMARAHQIRQHSTKALRDELVSRLSNMCTKYRSEAMRDLSRAALHGDVRAYETSFLRLTVLNDARQTAMRRNQLLERLEAVAPEWAAQIAVRDGIHGGAQLPGDVKKAWLWRQLNDELDNRNTVQLEPLQLEVEECSSKLREVTNQLIERKAWSAQLRRTDLAKQQALVSYAQILARIGKGTGRRVPRLREEARKAIVECRRAVPVWIMPLSEVAETFDPRVVRFDVVIIDEASQCDVMGMIALYLGLKVIIVGDEEQVSPVAVGQNQERVQNIIDEHLQGIPYSVLYDGRMSIYDLAKSSFGEAICLVEHFRCVPEIIGFSNYLSYNQRIRPLRDSSNVQLKPHVVSYRVSNGISSGKVNRVEARAVASLLLAAAEMPEYRDKSFGAISLVGDEQALEIDRLIRSLMAEIDYAEHQILCGNPAHFQGDERDVIFLSMVDGPSDGTRPLTIRAEGYQDTNKKRMNVAASRARDQIWVVHSLNPATDLKSGDLRAALIEYAENPAVFLRRLEQAEDKTESVFEREVLRRLVASGYRVIPQWNVGGYRIDLVVQGDGRRLAIECDGDRYHTLDNLRADNARQALLERLGWTFVRIRGSEFFRYPDKAMELVFRRLRELGIPPERDQVPSDDLFGVVSDERTQAIIRRAAEIRAAVGWSDEIPQLGKSNSRPGESRWAGRAPGSVECTTGERDEIRTGQCSGVGKGLVLIDGEAAVSIQDEGISERTLAPSRRSEGSDVTPKRGTLARGKADGTAIRAAVGESDVTLPGLGIDITAQTEQADQHDPLVMTASLYEDDKSNLVWATSISPEIWFSLAHWAKENGVLQPWERSLAFSMGRLTSRGRQLSVKQARQARRIHSEAAALGFSADVAGENQHGSECRERKER